MRRVDERGEQSLLTAVFEIRADVAWIRTLLEEGEDPPPERFRVPDATARLVAGSSVPSAASSLNTLPRRSRSGPRTGRASCCRMARAEDSSLPMDSTGAASTDRNGVVQLMTSGKWNGWDYSGGKWTLGGNSTVNGTLYS
jgi:hypothetical protein